MKQRQRRFKRATRDLGPNRPWHSLRHCHWDEGWYNEASAISAKAWASLDKEFRDRVQDIVFNRNNVPWLWDTGSHAY